EYYCWLYYSGAVLF
nr:immunoglobulin light chain junction region [Macaca mulatta]MOW58184.1 immunoglobulin light chain junction region [Macaca mulatta]MOW58445.1 immunoglobulin light chain junction region [Macaca mulatta]MOW59126.1 immunoglobulin light chain junction region [Macaca mulatta]MOW60537.1 immunoglobulin light chain junction region [Macaca mulatta]